VVLVEGRVLVAGTASLAYAAFTRKLPELRSRWRGLLVVGAVNSALPFVLIWRAERHLPASLAATLNATALLFGALVAAWWLGEPLTARKAAGPAVGLAGVAVLVGLGPLAPSGAVLWSIAASLLAALSYGLAAVYVKAEPAGVPPMALATYSQLFAALALLPAIPFALPAGPPSAVVVGSVLVLAPLSTAYASA
jgi:drug/metabolite transporter (DMT)-like permease